MNLSNVLYFWFQQARDPDEALPAEARTASLSDLSCVEDIEGLSVRQLKEILSHNFVNFMGCCEKWELMERVTRLYNEVRSEGEGLHGGSSDGSVVSPTAVEHTSGFQWVPTRASSQ